MTHLSNDPKQFAETALRGYCDIHARIVLATPGGVLRATTTPEGKVAVVIGGYPSGVDLSWQLLFSVRPRLVCCV